jgi:hypothetical protein
MYTLYQNSANSTTGGTAIGPAGQNIEVTRILVGNPVTSGNIWLYDETNVGNVSNTTGLQAKLTLPGTLATGQLPFSIDLTDADGHGIILKSGGTVAIDQAMQVTLIWGYSQMNTNTI